MSFLEMSFFLKVNLLIVNFGIVFFEIGVFELTFVKCRVTIRCTSDLLTGISLKFLVLKTRRVWCLTSANAMHKQTIHTAHSADPW